LDKKPSLKINERAGSVRMRFAINQSVKPTHNPRPTTQIPIRQGDPVEGNVACCIVGNVVMMLGAQRAVLVPFLFPVFRVNLRKESSSFPTNANIARS